ncbi:MAG: hydroxymethylglutaryl-CoA lyase [Acidobacteriota bacterium]
MPESVSIIECPRDAFQGLSRFIPTTLKVEYLRSLVEAGFQQIDFGSFVSPEAVPQMQDSGQVAQAVRPLPGHVTLIGIVPNLRGLETLIETGGIRCAGYPLSLSPTFQQRNVRQTPVESWRVVEALLSRSRESGIELVIYLSMAFGNPYGDAWSPDLVLSFAQKAAGLGVERIALADTVGMAQPDQVARLFRACRQEFPNTTWGVHLHARPEIWTEPVMAAFEAGCRRFDGALQGIGGCPFAEDRLVGNIPTEEMVRHFNRMGLITELSDVALEKPLALARQISSQYA